MRGFFASKASIYGRVAWASTFVSHSRVPQTAVVPHRMRGTRDLPGTKGVHQAASFVRLEWLLSAESTCLLPNGVCRFRASDARQRQRSWSIFGDVHPPTSPMSAYAVASGPSRGLSRG